MISHVIASVLFILVFTGLVVYLSIQYPLLGALLYAGMSITIIIILLKAPNIEDEDWK